MTVVLPSPGPFKRWTSFQRNFLKVYRKVQIGTLTPYTDPDVPEWRRFVAANNEWGTLLTPLLQANAIASIFVYPGDESMVARVLLPDAVVMEGQDGRASPGFNCFEINGCALGVMNGTPHSFPAPQGPVYGDVVLAHFTQTFFAALPFTYSSNGEYLDLEGKSSGARLGPCLGSPDPCRLAFLVAGGRLPDDQEAFRIFVYHATTLIQREILPP